jgi:aryl-alcohol dehydrogenase-like predicted oxidoreductase
MIPRRRLGRTGMEVSVLGFGGSEIGYEGVSGRTVARLVEQAVDAGLNVIDTAECYESSEELLGRALGRRRQEVHLFTKCGHGGGWSRPDWRSASLLKSIERSLRRLRTDYLDLIQLHSCALAELRKGEAIEALEQARKRGWTRFIGYSGDGAAARHAVESGRFDVLQISVNIADQEALELTLPAARSREMGVIAKRPLANVAWRHARKPDEAYYQEYWTRLRKLDYPFLKEELDQAVAVSLRFTLSVPGVHTAIVGTTRPGRWQENATLLQGGDLAPVDFQRIRNRWHEAAKAAWTGQV